jgi:predicted dinucleotide-binding enzyme
MKIAVLGTGMVGNALATKLVQVGHQVVMGSRTASSDAGQEWLCSVGGKGQIGTFANAAAFGELIISCTSGANSVAALRQAGEANLRGKIVIDVSDPLDMSQKPPTLVFCNTDSLGERIQREFPETIVVKALNTVNCEVTINPSLAPGDHDLFICGNDPAAKVKVSTLATSPTRAELKCILRFGFDSGANSAHRTSTSGSFAVREDQRK